MIANRDEGVDMLGAWRFRDHTGRRPPLSALLSGPRALYQTFLRKGLGIYPRLPWIPFNAIRHFDRLIQPSWEIREIGAGMSTLWYAARCRRVVSVEAQEEWFHRLSQILQEEGRKNVDLRYEWEETRMADFSEHPDGSLDLVVVDGGPRESCVRNALDKVRPGGYLYLDNSDSPFLCGRAVELLLDWVGNDPGSFRFFTDFVPGYFFASQGLLVRRPGPTESTGSFSGRGA